jgi:hypothetical protein
MTSEGDVKEEKTLVESPSNGQLGLNGNELSLKEYFDEKLYPHLSAALAACALERPVDPVSFVGNFLINAAKGSQ